jgi:hypothetical protein
MLIRNKELWLIDHGSCLYFHYNWEGWEKKATGPFQYIKDHVLLPQASELEEANQLCRELIDETKIKEIIQLIPDEWLIWEAHDESPEQIRDVYSSFLIQRLHYSPHFIKEAQDAKNVYEYAVIRVVPLVEREEFVNVGVIVFCKKQKFISMRFQLKEDKILALKPDADLQEIKQNLEAFRKIAAGETDGGPIALLDEAERFRWLTAVRSASIQTSRPHPGVSDDLEKAAEKLFDEMVA